MRQPTSSKTWACGPAPPSPVSTSATPRPPSTEPAGTDTMTTGLFFLAVMLLGVPIGGITRRLVELAMGFVGSVRGGLAYVNILANMMLASIIGSATAQVAIMSKIMVPQMEKQGYDKTFAAGVTVYGGMLGHHDLGHDG